MQIDLQTLTATHFDLDLTQAAATPERRQRVLIDSISGLAGKLETSDAGLRLTDVSAASAQLGALRLLFGSVLLDAAAETLLTRVSSELEQPQDGALNLTVGLERLTCPHLSVTVGSIQVFGQLDASLFELRVDEAGGAISAEDVNLQGFGFRLDELSLVAPLLRAGTLQISWGEKGFQLRAERIDCNLIDIALQGTVVRGEQLRADLLRVHDSDLSVSALKLAHVEARMDLNSASADVGAEPADLTSDLAPPAADPESSSDAGENEPDAAKYHPELPIFDWRLLDFVTGQLNVDLGLRIQLPLLTRRGVHELRVPVERGTLDFRELERDLSALEESLLDFSVRGDQLVLELGLPLLPTRGHGKPLVRWNLGEPDRELASRDRVRLATLARPLQGGTGQGNGAKSSRPPSSERRTPLLRELALRNLLLELSVAPAPLPMAALLRSFSTRQLRVSGEVVHEADAHPISQVEASMREVAFDLDDFPVSGRRFDLRDVKIAQVPSVCVQFAGARPGSFELSLRDFSSRTVDLGRFAV